MNKSKKKITIEGMHCSHCAQTVEQTLNSIPNVAKTKVNLKKNNAEITITGEVNDEQIRNKISEHNFTVTNIETK